MKYLIYHFTNHEVMGSNPVKVLTFSGFYTQLLKLRSYTYNNRSLLDFKSAVQHVKYFIYHFANVRSQVQTPLKSLPFQASIRNCLNCVHTYNNHSLLDFKSAVQHVKYFIYHFTNVRSQVQTPLKSLPFQASIRNCLNCVHTYNNHSLLDFKSAVQHVKYFIYHFTNVRSQVQTLLKS